MASKKRQSETERDEVNREALTDREILRVMEASTYLLDLHGSRRAGRLDPVLAAKLSALHDDVQAEKEDRARLRAESRRVAMQDPGTEQESNPEAAPGAGPEELNTDAEPEEAELAARC